MMLPLQEILNKYSVHPKGCIQVGAHFCEEHEELVKCGVERFVYIEPCKDAFNVIINKFGIPSNFDTTYAENKHLGGASDMGNGVVFGFSFFNVACGAFEKDEAMYVSHQNQGQSNSLLKPNLHTSQHPEVIFDDAEVVKVLPLDKLIHSPKEYSLLMMDVQGYEGEVLKGATETLKHIDIIYTEVNRGQTYAGNMEIEEMDELLSDFKRVETYWPSPNWTWGDAVYIRKTLL